jgi:tetratricopeptide (TPR) repeat protein
MRLREHVAASVHLLRGRRQSAVDAFGRILARDPADPSALPMVLNDLRSRRQPDEVIATAQRALAAMPDNFFALDALAWARIRRGEHDQAKHAIDRALLSLRDLGVEKPLGWAASLSIGVVRLAARLPLLRRTLPHVPAAQEIQARSAEWVAGWRTWAYNYLEWYEREGASRAGRAVQQGYLDASVKSESDDVG